MAIMQAALRIMCSKAHPKIFSPCSFVSYHSALNFSTVGPLYDSDLQTQDNEQLDKLYKTIEIEMRACEPATMRSYRKFAVMAAECLGITVGNCWAPKRPHHNRENLTLLRSAFVHKKHRTQYEVRTYFHYVTVHYVTGSTADTYLEYIERNLPEGVALKITKVAIEKLPEVLLHPPEGLESVAASLPSPSEPKINPETIL